MLPAGDAQCCTERNAAAAEIVGSSRVAVLVPCYNEETAIGKVVADFRAALPEAAHLCL